MSSLWSPADRVPVEGEGAGRGEGAEGDHQRDVEHRRAQHAAHAHLALPAGSDDDMINIDRRRVSYI